MEVNVSNRRQILRVMVLLLHSICSRCPCCFLQLGWDWEERAQSGCRKKLLLKKLCLMHWQIPDLHQLGFSLASGERDVVD